MGGISRIVACVVTMSGVCAASMAVPPSLVPGELGPASSPPVVMRAEVASAVGVPQARLVWTSTPSWDGAGAVVVTALVSRSPQQQLPPAVGHADTLRVHFVRYDVDSGSSRAVDTGMVVALAVSGAMVRGRCSCAMGDNGTLACVQWPSRASGRPRVNVSTPLSALGVEFEPQAVVSPSGGFAWSEPLSIVSDGRGGVLGVARFVHNGAATLRVFRVQDSCGDATAHGSANDTWTQPVDAGKVADVAYRIVQGPALANNGAIAVVGSRGVNASSETASYLMAVDVRSGHVLWRHPGSSPFQLLLASAPVTLEAAVLAAAGLNASGDAVCAAASTGSSVICLEASSGSIVFETSGAFVSPLLPISAPSFTLVSAAAILPSRSSSHTFAQCATGNVLVAATVAPTALSTMWGVCQLASGGAVASTTLAHPPLPGVANDAPLNPSAPIPLYTPPVVFADAPSLNPSVANKTTLRTCGTVLLREWRSISWTYHSMDVQPGGYLACFDVLLAESTGFFVSPAIVKSSQYALLEAHGTEFEGVPATASPSAEGGSIATATADGAIAVFRTEAPAQDTRTCASRGSARNLTSLPWWSHPVVEMCNACAQNLPSTSGLQDALSEAHVALGQTLFDAMLTGENHFHAVCVAASGTNALVPAGAGCELALPTGAVPPAHMLWCVGGNTSCGRTGDAGGTCGVNPFDTTGVTTLQSDISARVDCSHYSFSMAWYTVLSLAPLAVTICAAALWVCAVRRGWAPSVLTRPSGPHLIGQGCSAGSCCGKRRGPPASLAATQFAHSQMAITSLLGGACWAFAGTAELWWANLPPSGSYDTGDMDSCIIGYGGNEFPGGFPPNPNVFIPLLALGPAAAAMIAVWARSSTDLHYRFGSLVGLIFPVACITVLAIHAAGEWDGMGPREATQIGGVCAVFWALVGYWTRSTVPIDHPYLRSHWAPMNRSLNWGVAGTIAATVYLTYLAISPAGIPNTYTQGPISMVGGFLVLNTLVTNEQRSCILRAMDTWQFLLATREAGGSAADIASDRQALSTPASLLRVHALASLVPVLTIGHVAALLLLVIDLLPEMNANIATAAASYSDGYQVAGQLSGTATMASFVVIMVLSMLRLLVLQVVLKRSGENALLRTGARSLLPVSFVPEQLQQTVLRAAPNTRIHPTRERAANGSGSVQVGIETPLLSTNRSSTGRGHGSDSSAPAGASPAPSLGSETPPIGVIEVLALWSSTWTGQHTLGLLSHTLSATSIAIQLSTGSITDVAECEVRLALVAVLAMGASLVGACSSLVTLIGRYRLECLSRVVPVDDSFRVAITLKSIAVVLKAVLMRLGQESRGLGFWLLVFASCFSTCVLLWLMWVRNRGLLRVAAEDRTRRSRRADEEALLEGISSSDDTLPVFRGVVHPRLLIWLFAVGYTMSAVCALTTVAAAIWSQLSCDWFFFQALVFIPNKWLNNELALFLRSRDAEIQRRKRRASAVDGAQATGSDAAAGAPGVLLGASQSSEGVRSILSLTTAGIVAYLVAAPATGAVNFANDAFGTFDVFLMVTMIVAAAIVIVRNLLLSAALDGFFEWVYWCCCCTHRSASRWAKAT